jgi:hypothetical protein
MPEAFPAVTTPSALKYGGSFASPSGVVSGRMCSSAAHGSVARVFRFFTGTGTSSSAKAPACHAAFAHCWLRAA